MWISDIMNIGEITCVQDQYDDREVSGGYTSDLLSDVMANAQSGSILITIQAHLNTIAVAAHTETAAVIICSNRPIPEEMTAQAKEEKIAVFSTPQDQFSVSGIIYRILYG
jgi:predicted transcriptional regulator